MARAKPAAPPLHPNPKIGSRVTVSLNSSRLISNASMLGTASPVVELVTMTSMSCGASSAAANAFVATFSRRSSA